MCVRTQQCFILLCIQWKRQPQNRSSIPCLPAEARPPSSLSYPAVDPCCENRSIWRWILPHRETAAFYIELCLEHTDCCTIKQEVAVCLPKTRVSLKSSHGSFSFQCPSSPPHGNPCGIKTHHIYIQIHYRQRERGCVCVLASVSL